MVRSLTVGYMLETLNNAIDFLYNYAAGQYSNSMDLELCVLIAAVDSTNLRNSSETMNGLSDISRELSRKLLIYSRIMMVNDE